MIVARPAVPGRYVDTAAPCSDPVLASLAAAGYLGVGRYVPLPGVSGRADISPGELERITGHGLACWLVQHVRYPGWDPGAHNGAADADAACLAAKAAGYPQGAHLYLDLEGIKGTRPATLAFADAWQTLVIAHGFRAGLYVGYDVPLSPDDLYALRGFDTYFSDAGHRKVSTRGCALVQAPEVVIAGVRFDPDHVAADLLGDLPCFAFAA